MLGKLIKNDFKSTAHSMFGIFLSAAITFAVMILVFLLKNRTLMVLSSVVLGGICIAALIITLFSIVGSFNKSLYGAQGYLSFTLPVTGKQLLASKTIVALIWITISFAFTIGVIAFLVFYWTAQTSDSLKQTLQMVYQMLQSMQGFPDAGTAIKVISVLVIYIFIKALFLIFKVAFSLSMANTKKLQKYNPILIAILIYFGVYVILQVATIAAAYLPVYLAVGSSGIGLEIGETLIGIAENASIFLKIPILGYIFEAVVCILLYVATGNVMTNHVNIK